MDWIVSASHMSFTILIAFEQDSPRSVSSMGLVALVAKGQLQLHGSVPSSPVCLICLPE